MTGDVRHARVRKLLLWRYNISRPNHLLKDGAEFVANKYVHTPVILKLYIRPLKKPHKIIKTIPVEKKRLLEYAARWGMACEARALCTPIHVHLRLGFLPCHTLILLNNRTTLSRSHQTFLMLRDCGLRCSLIGMLMWLTLAHHYFILYISYLRWHLAYIWQAN
jgi:hypothetical protein